MEKVDTPSKEELEAKARTHFRFDYRNRFNKTKAAKALLLATGALMLGGVALVFGPPLLFGGLAAGVQSGFGTMLAGLAVATSGFIPITIDSILSRKFQTTEMDKDIANGTLVERYKNEHIAGLAKSYEIESANLAKKSEGLLQEAAGLKIRAGELRTTFGIADANALPEATDSTVQKTSLRPASP